MASQAAMIADTIIAMKRAVKRKAYESDSDASIERLTNRGNKLRKRARYVQQGQLAPPNGRHIYRETIDHAGYTRDIISRKPPLFDEDGEKIDSDEEDEEKISIAKAAAAEFDPYANIKLEELLAPLTSVSDLPDHPKLSQPFTSKVLTELTRNAGEMLQKEMASLWKIKHLLTRLSGHDTWMPCETVETEYDASFFETETERRRAQVKRIAKQHADMMSRVALASDDDSVAASGLMIMGIESDAASGVAALQALKGKGRALDVDRDMTSNSANGEITDTTAANGTGNDSELAHGLTPPPDNVEMDQEGSQEPGDAMDIEPTAEDNEDDTVMNAVPRRMRTRAQAQAVFDNATRSRSITPDLNGEPFVHPYFLAPENSYPDRDLYLPHGEADELRRLLVHYIQKQEEIIRGAQKVYDGLLRADRMRHLVLKWTKAEGHVGNNRDMSDGEDWYDKDEWGLDEDLKKGQDEEEEDAATTAKKTRTRRQ
ncbi:uncharacterized protein EAF01_011218 [Botrytis porri]|uniref:Transcriptional regulatory protein RXT2 N-terminal domain-containing protein n=1 Tax=Botrytis porri TaxID=87229 RepID=A0A4Z1K5K0_9HELO|nr:uncharacterized protein EAF01_011218 [Botrytis porri]KAF7886540.1 hypothetical protein EAF01_011218 [Botrytis porri]TGO81419.1 hypothetical protein BPOR_1164g00020 [Botrytis porri]